MAENQPKDNSTNLLRNIKPSKIFLPIFIGLGVVFFMLYRDINIDRIQLNVLNTKIEKNWYTIESSPNHDTLICVITDKIALASDSLKLEVKYFVEKEKGLDQLQDTFTLYNNSGIFITNEEKHLLKAFRDKEKISFYFNKPVRNPFFALKITWQNIIFIFLAISMMVFRDVGYMWRFRVLADNTVTWLQSFRVIMLWEFTSAITPSAVGGTSVAVLYVTKEGISVGRSTAIVLLTSFLDELYFVLMVPMVLIFVSASDLFSIAGREAYSFTNEFFYFASIGYSLILIYTIALGYGMFFNPKGLKWILVKIFHLPILKRWIAGAEKAGDDMIVCSQEFRNKSISFWFKAIFSTFLSWTGRYWIVNFLLLSFIVVGDHFLIFARQLVMWIMMLVSPTPGGSGFSEFIFKQYLGEFITPISLAIVLALIWRLITYYPYLIVGAIILPRWLKKHFTN